MVFCVQQIAAIGAKKSNLYVEQMNRNDNHRQHQLSSWSVYLVRHETLEDRDQQLHQIQMHLLQMR